MNQPSLLQKLLLTFTLCLGIGLATSGTATAQLKVGAAAYTITPLDWSTRPYYLAGFGQNRVAEGVHDDLWARAIVMDDGMQRIAIISLDLVGWMSWRINPMKEALAAEQGFNLNNIIIMSSHVHEAPDTMGQWGPDFLTSGLNVNWMNYIDDQIKRATLDATLNMKPARMRFAAGRTAGMSRDSRDPQVIDENVTIMQALGADGNAIVTLVNYGSHPEALWSGNKLITSDFPHYVRRTVEQRYGGLGFWGSGSLGGLTTPIIANRTYDACEEWTNRLMAPVLPNLERAVIYDDLRITMQRRRVSVPIDNPLFILLASINIFEVPLSELTRNNNAVPTDVNYLELARPNGGPVVASFATAYGELFPETFLNDIKPHMRGEHRVIFNMGNNELGYLVPPDVFLFPENPFEAGDNYEETNSPGIEAVPVLLGALYDMIGFQTPTPTPTITPTPTQTSTPSPTPTPRPQVYLAGFMETRISAPDQPVQIVAYALSHRLNRVRKMRVYVDYRYTGIEMEADRNTDGLFSLTTTQLGLPPGQNKHLILLQPEDNRRDSGAYWPFLTVFD